MGSVRGGVFEVSVTEPVTIVSQPKDSRVNNGSVSVFEVESAGTGPLPTSGIITGESNWRNR